MNRSVFIVDGFNLYHSLRDAQQISNGKTTKWLDLKSLCEDYLSLVGSICNERASLERIYYFSARPTHRSLAKQHRHTLYMRCLRGMGVTVELARFKKKTVWCPLCKDKYSVAEEKETDVALATRLFETCYTNEADTRVLMTGDTDLAPAVRLCKRLFNTLTIFFSFPFRRKNSELAVIAPDSFSIKLRSCLRHQLPDPFVLPDGTAINKPQNW